VTPTERPRFAACLGTLAEVFRTEVSGVLAGTYFDALVDLFLPDVEAGARALVRTARYFPVPAEWREAARAAREARQLGGPRALPAWRSPEDEQVAREALAAIQARLVARVSRAEGPGTSQEALGARSTTGGVPDHGPTRERAPSVPHGLQGREAVRRG